MTGSILSTTAALWIASVIWTTAQIADERIATASLREALPMMTKLDGTRPAQCRVVWTGDASSTATISWSTTAAGVRHRVLLSEAGTTGAMREIVVTENGAYTMDKASGDKPGLLTHYHHARLRNLKPGTRYDFILESDGTQSRKYHFITAPAKGTDFGILHGGDSRTGHENRCRMNLRVAQQIRENPKLIALAHGGDYMGSGKSWTEWRMWLSHHELTTLPDGRVIPVIPCKGNHDGGKLYFETFGLDPDKQRWHVTRLGADVALLTLDTNSPATGEQERFMMEQLATLRVSTRWLLVQYHRPMFPAIKGPPTDSAVYVRNFEKFKVDLCLESDGHCMKRTCPILNGRPSPGGVVYLGEGGMGVGQREPERGLWYLENGGKASSGHHLVRLDFSPDSLRSRFIRLDQSVWDDYTLKRRTASARP